MASRHRELAKLQTIPALARQIGANRATLFRKLRALRREDLARGGEERALWMVRTGAGRNWVINEDLLRIAHAELFDAPDPRDMEERLRAVEEEIRELRHMVTRRLNAMAAAFRGHKQAHDAADAAAAARPAPRLVG
ncbi:MAG TPA: hypothetical protein VGM06_05505 [Polyangiaceae bacterium]